MSSTKTSTKQIKFLYEGNYSCVYYPPPKCDTKIDHIKHVNKPMVGKIIRPIDSLNEWDRAKELYKIDPKQKYFIYPYELCEILPTVDSHKCPLIQKNQKINMLTIPYVNNNILNYFIKKRKVLLKNFIPKLYHLLEGLAKLHKFGLIHQDIKVNNILEKDHDFFYIDFGISMKKKDVFNVEKNAAYLNADYMIHPPEYRYFSHYYYISKKIEQIDMFVDNEWYMLHYIIGENKLRNIDLYKNFYSYDEYKIKFSKMFNMLKNKTKLQISKIFTDQVTKVDIYSLGMVLLHIHPYLQMDPSSILAKSYIMLITNMINPNIFERYDTLECLNFVKQLVELL